MIPMMEIPHQLETTSGLTLDLAWFQRFEVFVAQELKASLSLGNKKGVDVYDSRLYPGLTVQVKASRELAYKSREGRLIFSFSSVVSDVLPDMYILFGVKDGMAYPFVLSSTCWQDRSSRGKSRGYDRDVLVCSSSQFYRHHPHQIALTQSRFWSDFYVGDWPAGLHQCVTGLPV